MANPAKHMHANKNVIWLNCINMLCLLWTIALDSNISHIFAFRLLMCQVTNLPMLHDDLLGTILYELVDRSATLLMVTTCVPFPADFGTLFASFLSNTQDMDSLNQGLLRAGSFLFRQGNSLSVHHLNGRQGNAIFVNFKLFKVLLPQLGQEVGPRYSEIVSAFDLNCVAKIRRYYRKCGIAWIIESPRVDLMNLAR